MTENHQQLYHNKTGFDRREKEMSAGSAASSVIIKRGDPAERVENGGKSGPDVTHKVYQQQLIKSPPPHSQHTSRHHAAAHAWQHTWLVS